MVCCVRVCLFMEWCRWGGLQQGGWDLIAGATWTRVIVCKAGATNEVAWTMMQTIWYKNCILVTHSAVVDASCGCIKTEQKLRTHGMPQEKAGKR